MSLMLGWSRWTSLSEWICSRTKCWDAAKPVGRPWDSTRRPRATNALMARRSLVLFRASYLTLRLRLLKAAIQGISAEMGHEHFFERTAVRYPIWAVQVGLLIPLTFTRHRLSPLAAFTSGAYFPQDGRRWQWICEIYTASFKGIFEGPK